MKKVLLGSTALVAAGLMAGPAFAQLEIGVSGSVDFHLGIASEDDPAGTDNRGYGVTTDTTLNFNADTVADNGLEYGVRINLDDEFQNNEGFMEVDETWVYVKGTFGQVRFGETDPAASELRFAIPTVGNGQTDGDFERYVNLDGEAFGVDFEYSDDDTKIVYIGEFGDFTVGASFSPDAAARMDDPAIISNDGDLEDVISLGGNFQGDFQGVSIGVSAGYNMGDVVGTAPNPGGDASEWGLGAEVGFGAITVGGFWIDSEVEDSAGVTELDRQRYGFGATFSTGPWSFAANALIAEDDAAPGAGDDVEDTVYGVGVEYSLAPGLTPYADLVFFDYDNQGAASGPGVDNDGSVFLVGVTASF